MAVLQATHGEGERCVQPQWNSVVPGEEYFQICAGELWRTLATPGLPYSAEHSPSGQSAFISNLFLFERKRKLTFDQFRICVLVVDTESGEQRPWILVQTLCHWRETDIRNF